MAPRPTRLDLSRPGARTHVVVRLLVVLALVVPVGAAASGGPQRRVGTAGLTLAVPAGWHSWVPSTAVEPTVTDPLTRIVAVSARFHFAAAGCQVAGYAFPATAVAIVIVEWVRNPGIPLPRGRPSRPSSFGAKELMLHAPPAIECFDGSGGSVTFHDHGRALSAYILAGRNASAATVARARSVLDTLRVHRR